MFLSIIIPVYQDAGGLKSTITTLLDNNSEISDFEIIICIDGGGEADINMSLEIIQLYPKQQITYHCIKINKGSYNARNIGAKDAIGNVFAFLDAGVYVQKGWYVALKKYIEVYDYIAGSVEIPWEWARDIFEKYESITAFPVKEYLSIEHFGPTANMIVRQDVFINVGGFDNRLLSGGDVEFGKKVSKSKYTQYFSSEILVLHAPRNKVEIMNKIDRVTKGLADLRKFHPNVFKKKNENNFVVLIKTLIKIFFFPSKFKSKQSNKLSWVDFVITESTVAYYRFISQTKYL